MIKYYFTSDPDTFSVYKRESKYCQEDIDIGEKLYNFLVYLYPQLDDDLVCGTQGVLHTLKNKYYISVGMIWWDDE